MVFPLAGALGVVQGAQGVLGAVGGFLDNSENEAIHNRNKLKVAQIDAENQQRHLRNLQSLSGYQNQAVRSGKQLDTIQTRAAEARAASQRQISSAEDEAVMANEANYIRAMRNMRARNGGTGVGNRAVMASLGRQRAAGARSIDQLRNQMITKEAINARMVRDQRSDVLAPLANKPIYEQYIDKYTPEKYKSKGFMDYANLALGVAGGVVDGMKTYDQFKPEKILKDPNKTPSFGEIL